MKSARLQAAKSGLRRERGQVLVFMTILIAAILGITAFAIDVGSYATDRRDLQNAADAIALAASRELPNQDAATAKAQAWATKNNIRLADMTLTFTAQNLPSAPNPKVRVTLQRSHNFVFAPAIGVQSSNVSAVAAAIRTSPAGGDGVIPLSVTEAALSGAGFGQPVVLKYDSNNITTGNTGPIRIDGPGSGNCTTSDTYCDGLEFGGENVVCANGADDTYCGGPSVVDTEPGNHVGATRTAIDYRMDNTDSHCDSFSEVFQDDPTSSDSTVYSFNQACNPFVASAYASERVVIIPVINELCNGACAVTIVDFALFFLDGYGDGCTGVSCEVTGRFVRVHQNVGMLAGTFDATSSNTFVRLVE